MVVAVRDHIARFEKQQKQRLHNNEDDDDRTEQILMELQQQDTTFEFDDDDDAHLHNGSLSSFLKPPLSVGSTVHTDAMTSSYATSPGSRSRARSFTAGRNKSTNLQSLLAPAKDLKHHASFVIRSNSIHTFDSLALSASAPCLGYNPYDDDPHLEQSDHVSKQAVWNSQFDSGFDNVTPAAATAAAGVGGMQSLPPTLPRPRAASQPPLRVIPPPVRPLLDPFVPFPSSSHRTHHSSFGDDVASFAHDLDEDDDPSDHNNPYFLQAPLQAPRTQAPPSPTQTVDSSLAGTKLMESSSRLLQFHNSNLEGSLSELELMRQAVNPHQEQQEPSLVLNASGTDWVVASQQHLLPQSPGSSSKDWTVQTAPAALTSTIMPLSLTQSPTKTPKSHAGKLKLKKIKKTKGGGGGGGGDRSVLSSCGASSLDDDTKTRLEQALAKRPFLPNGPVKIRLVDSSSSKRQSHTNKAHHKDSTQRGARLTEREEPSRYRQGGDRSRSKTRNDNHDDDHKKKRKVRSESRTTTTTRRLSRDDDWSLLKAPSLRSLKSSDSSAAKPPTNGDASPIQEKPREKGLDGSPKQQKQRRETSPVQQHRAVRRSLDHSEAAATRTSNSPVVATEKSLRGRRSVEEDDAGERTKRGRRSVDSSAEPNERTLRERRSVEGEGTRRGRRSIDASDENPGNRIRGRNHLEALKKSPKKKTRSRSAAPKSHDENEGDPKRRTRSASRGKSPSRRRSRSPLHNNSSHDLPTPPSTPTSARQRVGELFFSPFKAMKSVMTSSALRSSIGSATPHTRSSESTDPRSRSPNRRGTSSDPRSRSPTRRGLFQSSRLHVGEALPTDTTTSSLRPQSPQRKRPPLLDPTKRMSYYDDNLTVPSAIEFNPDNSTIATLDMTPEKAQRRMSDVSDDHLFRKIRDAGITEDMLQKLQAAGLVITEG